MLLINFKISVSALCMKLLNLKFQPNNISKSTNKTPVKRRPFDQLENARETKGGNDHNNVINCNHIQQTLSELVISL